MAIKLTPEHVGTRVMMNDGAIGLICHFHGDHVAVRHNLWSDLELFDLRGNELDPDYPEHRITLLLDAPNPLDVPVPEWCSTIVLWQPRGKSQRLRPAGFLRKQEWGKWLTLPEGWSPAPGQMPPREDA